MKARKLVVACSGVFLAGALGGGYAANGAITSTGKAATQSCAIAGNKNCFAVEPLGNVGHGRHEIRQRRDGVIDLRKAVVSEQGAKPATVKADGGAMPNYYVGMAKEEQHYWYWKVLQSGAKHGRMPVSEPGARRLRHRIAPT